MFSDKECGMEITTKVGCVNACTYCPQDVFTVEYAKRSDKLLMSFDDFKKCINKIPKDMYITFSGMCEPWLNPDCTEMLLYAYNKGHKVKMFTSLIGMTPSDIGELSNVHFDFALVHLPSEGDYEKIKIDDNYLEVLKKIEKSNIDISYVFRGKKLHPKVRPLIEKTTHTIHEGSLNMRANNIQIENRYFMKKKLEL